MEIVYKVLNDCRNMYPEEVIEKILNTRGIKDKDHFLNPNENDLLPLNSLINIDKAKDIVVDALNNNKTIKILWDVDLDGVASGTILERYLKQYSSNVFSYINEGKVHGLMNQNLEEYMNTDVLIVVDSLDANITAYKKISDNGVKIIVLDHHDIDKKIDYSKYITLVSSQNSYQNPALSGAGVVWKFCKYIDEELLENYADELVDLAACGLVGDMSDMSENSMENRYIVSKGLEKINNPAIKKIVGSFPFNSTAIAFSIAPLINAANRTSNNEIAMKSFLADENKQVLAYIKELKKCKEIQNDEVNNLMENILNQADKQVDKKVISIFIKTDIDISGLIGNKLLEKYQRPLLILKERIIKDEKYYGGSARAIGVKDFRKMCIDTKLCEANGHPLAFGISIKQSNYDEFINSISTVLDNINFVEEKSVDIELNLEDITRDLIDKIKVIDKISGEGFKPVIAKISNITNYTIGNMSNMKHLIIKPSDYIQLIKWNFNGDWNEMEDNSLLEEPITVVGNLDSGWLGRTFSLKLICNEIKVGD